MSDPLVPPAAVPPVVAPPAPPAPPAPETAPTTDPNWMPARLERHSAAVLKSLGVSTQEEATLLIKAGREAAEAKRTLEEKFGTTTAELAREREKNASLSSAINERAAYELSTLTAVQQAAVRGVAGDDTAAQLRAIAAMRPTWAAEPAAPVVAAPLAPPAGAPPPPAPPAPPGGSQPVDHKATHARLKAENPYQAALYLVAHRAAIQGAPNA